MAQLDGGAQLLGNRNAVPDSNGDGLKGRILEVLRLHPEGFTILELSKELGSHRQTVTKYVLVLEALGLIYRRRLGSATLHYLREAFEAKMKEGRMTAEAAAAGMRKSARKGLSKESKRAIQPMVSIGKRESG